MAELPCADLENIFPDLPEPSDRFALERGTTGSPEESGEESMNCARPQGPKALHGSRQGEKPRGQVQINMYSASVRNAPEAPLQTQTGSPQCDPENITSRPHQDFRFPVGAEGDEPLEEEVHPEALLQIGWAEEDVLTLKREVALSRGGPKAILEDRPARLEARPP